MEFVEEFTARVLYYCREGYWRAMQNVATEAIEKFPYDATFKFFQALSFLFQRQAPEALRILNPLTQQHILSLGAILASIASHREFTNVDEEEIEALETKLRDTRKTAKPDDLYYAALFLSLSGRHKKSKEYLDRAINGTKEEHLDALSLRGWLEIEEFSNVNYQKEKGKTNTAAEYFDTVLAKNRKHLDARLGLARQYEMTREFQKTIDELNAILSFCPNWIPSLMEKMKTAVSMQDWNQAMEIVTRIVSIDPNNLESQRMKIIYLLCREGDLKLAEKSLDFFFTSCKQNEPQNSVYFNENGRVFSQLGSYSRVILEKSLEFCQHAHELEGDNEEYIVDMGRIYLLMKRYKEAHDHFITASKMNNASLPALYGLITCQLAEGEIDLASQQLNFLRELSSSIEPSPELFYLDAVLAIKENQSSEVILTNLNESVERHIQQIRKYPLNVHFLKVVNPEFVIKIVREYLVFAPQEPITKGMKPPVAVVQASLVLEMLTKICPAHQDSLFIDAQIKYLSGDFNAASLILNKSLKMNSTATDVHLLLAQVQIAQNVLDQASLTLESALSNNFAVRENPKYHLLLAKVQVSKKEFKTAKQTLENSLKLFGTLEGKNLKKRNEHSDGVGDEEESSVNFTLADQFSVYIELIAVLRALGLTDEAKVRMEEAATKFKDTHLEGRLSLTAAEDHMDKGEIPLAMEILRKVTPDQHHFVEAQKMLAEIYLNYKRDRKAYTICFGEIVKYYPTPPNLVLLGEAYMHIQEPDKAIEAFESALVKNPRDPLLTAKLGEALIRTHQFNKAINFYQDAVMSDENFPLRLELANLQYRLGKWDGAEKTIQQALGDLRDSGLTRQIAEVDLLTLLAKVQRGAGNYHQAQQTLIKGKDFQSRVLKRALLEQPSIIEKMKIQYCKICQLVGEIAERPNEIEFAIKSIKEAMELRPDDWEILSTLCKLYMKLGDFPHCQQTCIQLQTLNPESDAAIMLGELCYRRGDFANSLLHYQNYLNKHPVHWESLSWYIEGTRRCGFLLDAELYIRRAASHSDSHDPGLGYSQGLYEWYNGNVNSALKMLNMARKDSLFGQRTILLMIEIYLNPYGTVMGGDALEGASGEAFLANGNVVDTKEGTSKAVESLLRDLTIKTGEDKFRRQILECYALIITRNKNKVEKAIQELSGLVTTDVGRESVMLVHALATAYMFMKQVPRARNQLKRIVKANWTIEDAEYLERCWLLLADIHIQSSKYDLATDLIKKVLQYNKSCIKANEYLGLIMEKEQAYADAAINYEQAWKLTNTANPAIGYKLAFNYLKAKRFTDAIDVCHIVIAKHPNYPKIKKDILDKARNSLRM